MKTILIFLICLTSSAQVSLGIYQDTKLLITGDSKHNYPAGTIDIIADLEMKGKQFKHYYFAVKAQYEYANLQSDFHRYSLHAGWVFNKCFKNWEYGIFAGVGVIRRGKELKIPSVRTYSIMSEIRYKLNKKLSLGLKYELLKRNDLKMLYNDNVLKPNISIGVNYNL